MAMMLIKPHLVVDHQGKERELEDLTLAKTGNDVRVYPTKMQKKRNKIDVLHKDKVKFDGGGLRSPLKNSSRPGVPTS